jgi:hypothetical protein
MLSKEDNIIVFRWENIKYREPIIHVNGSNTCGSTIDIFVGAWGTLMVIESPMSVIVGKVLHMST